MFGVEAEYADALTVTCSRGPGYLFNSFHGAPFRRRDGRHLGSNLLPGMGNKTASALV
jgi:hypothetical protein